MCWSLRTSICHCRRTADATASTCREIRTCIWIQEVAQHTQLSRHGIMMTQRCLRSMTSIHSSSYFTTSKALTSSTWLPRSSRSSLGDITQSTSHGFSAMRSRDAQPLTLSAAPMCISTMTPDGASGSSRTSPSNTNFSRTSPCECT